MRIRAAANGSTLGRNLNAGSTFKAVQLMREGLDYGDQNLSQLDLRGASASRSDGIGSASTSISTTP